MDISILIPEDVVHQIESKWKDVPRRALEALAIEAYRSGVITEADLQHDIDTIRKLKSK